MDLLLDTHILIMMLNGDTSLDKKIIAHVNDPEKIKHVSIASFWEIAIKISLNKLNISGSFDDLWKICTNNNLHILAISHLHLKQLMQLPVLHKYPFDRLIISQAITENLMLITDDQYIIKYQT